MTVRPTPESYIPEFSKLKMVEEDSNDVVALDKLISIGGYITTYSAPDIATGFGRTNPYFHHDLWRLFANWRGIARRLLKKDKDLFAEEIDVLEESGEVHSMPLAQEDPDFGSRYADDLISKIQSETSRRLETLRIARRKAVVIEKQRVEKSSPATYNPDTGVLVIQGNPIEMSQNTKKQGLGNKQCSMLKVLFESPNKSLPCDEFWAEWDGQNDKQVYEQRAKKNWDSIYQTARRINVRTSHLTEDNDVFIDVTKDYVAIVRKYTI